MVIYMGGCCVVAVRVEQVRASRSASSLGLESLYQPAKEKLLSSTPGLYGSASAAELGGFGFDGNASTKSRTRSRSRSRKRKMMSLRIVIMIRVARPRPSGTRYSRKRESVWARLRHVSLCKPKTAMARKNLNLLIGFKYLII